MPNYVKIMISENKQNQILETFISMKIDAECDENAPAIAFDRFRKDLNIFKQNTKSWIYKRIKDRYGISDL